jgi:hypothetical protein
MTELAVAAPSRIGGSWLTFSRATWALPIVTGSSAAASIGLVEYKVWRTPHFPYLPIVVGIAATAFVASTLIAALLHWATSNVGRRGTGVGRSWLIALEIGVLLTPLAVVLLARAVAEDEITGFTFPLVNKRWLLALYNLAVVTTLVLPLAIERWRSGPDASLPPTDVAADTRPRPAWAAILAGQSLVIALCWFLGGPPWHLDRHHRVIDWHEQLHLGPLLAIHQGHLPFVGAAATPYGPASQWLTSGLMRVVGSFDIVSFRTAWAIQQFAATLAVGVAAVWWLGALPAVAVVLLSFTYSPVAFFQTNLDGTWGGLYGWSNACRYLAPLLVVPMVAELAPRAIRFWQVMLIGSVWAAGALLAQESLTTTGTAILLVVALLWLTRTITLSRALYLGCGLAVGCAAGIVPVLIFYGTHGAAGEFVRTYFFFARAVVAGFSNSWWPLQDAARPDRITYYLTLPFLLACGIACLWQVPAFEVARLNRSRRLFLAFVCVMIVCYQTALTRSDAGHLMNTMIALPFVIVIGAMYVPEWVAAPARLRYVARLAFLAVVLFVFPTVRQVAEWRRFTVSLARFETGQLVNAGSVPNENIAVRRATPQLADEPRLVDGGTVSIREFLTFATEIKQLVGQRKTYFLQIGWTTTGALIAFMADLQVASHPLGGELLNINDQTKAIVAEYIRAHPQEYGAFIGPSLDDPEARAFLSSHPGAAQIQRTLGTATVHVLLANN